MPKEWTDGLALLPDELGTVAVQDGLGLVRSAEFDMAKAAAKAMRAPAADGPNVLAVKGRAVDRIAQGDTAQWRGMLAAALLMDTWQTECQLKVFYVRPETSALSASVLAAAGRPGLSLAILQKGDRRVLLGMVDRELLIVPAAQRERAEAVLPQQVTWYDAEQGVFCDPCAKLNQRDRLRLAARLKISGGGEAVLAFRDDILAEENRRAQLLDADWETRMKAVLSLSREPVYADLLARSEAPYAAGLCVSPLLDTLGVREEIPPTQPKIEVWSWRGVPFAISNATIGAESALDPKESEALEELRWECAQLEQGSGRYQRDLCDRLARYLLSQGEHFSQPAREQIVAWQTAARAAVREPGSTLALTWPWQTTSPSVRLLMTEALGEQMAEGAAGGFSDRLTLLTGASFDDPMLEAACTVNVDGVYYLAIPPLSDALAERMARFGWTGRGLLAECMRLECGEEGAVSVSLLLSGEGSVRISRTYAAHEITRWGAEETPQVALWPSAPLAHGRWKRYFVSVDGRMDVSVLDHDRWVQHRNETGVQVIRTDEFPGAISLHRGGLCMGALLYQPPVFHPEDKGEMLGALDLGASGIAMAVSVDEQMQPVAIPNLRKVLLRGAEKPLAEQPLPAWPVGPILPGAVVRTGESADPQPFEDGFALLDGAAEDTQVREQAMYDLLWRTDAAGRGARRLLIREALLLTAFHGVMNGANSVRWRAALPSAVADAGRDMLLREVTELAAEISREVGLPMSGFGIDSLRASHASAIWLRESGLMRSFAVLDIGGGSVNASVWMRGVDQPVMAFGVNGGLSAMAAAGLSERPGRIREDFEGCEGLPAEQLATLMERAGSSMRAWEKSRLTLEHMLGAHLPLTAQWMNAKCAAGQMTYLQALLVSELAGLMTLTGMLLEKVFHNPMLNDYLPREMPLCLCGRGSLLMTSMDETLRYQLRRFLRLTMSGNHPVQSIRLTMSGTPRMEAVQLLCRPGVLPVVNDCTPGPVIAPTDVLVKYFLMQFAACFPQAAAQLYPGMFGAGGMLTPEAENAVNAAVARATGSEEERFMSCINALRRG